uniref:Uncharacterized protein n=1 Tax=Arcella intermedia TaxID=1963864 RepID=A0A6B2LHA2_9EUKA
MVLTANNTAITEFIIIGSLQLQQNSTLLINGVSGGVTGNLDVAEGSTIIFNFDTGGNPSLNVSGCVRINGTLNVVGLQNLNPSNPKILVQFSSNCSTSSVPHTLSNFPVSNSKCVGEIKQSTSTIFALSNCQQGSDSLGPILGGVLGGLFVFSSLFLLIVYNNKTLTHIFLPWKNRAHHTSAQHKSE